MKAGRVLRALRRIGWTIKRQAGSHRILAREGWDDYVFAFHQGEEIGPRMLAHARAHRKAYRSAAGGFMKQIVLARQLAAPAPALTP